MYSEATHHNSKYSVSVVIPSLGGDLSKTLNSLNSGTVKPNEIIICLPNKDYSVKDVSIYKKRSSWDKLQDTKKLGSDSSYTVKSVEGSSPNL